MQTVIWFFPQADGRLLRKRTQPEPCRALNLTSVHLR